MPDTTEKVIEKLKEWQAVEKATIEKTTRIIGLTKNPLVQLVMEIIRQDSTMHHRVQQFIIDSMTTTPISLTPEELGDVWADVEEHIRMERQTVGYGEDLLKDCKLFTQTQLISYLLADERKHDMLLTKLEEFKRKLYPYA
jgi:hypothetical protein